jgi:RHS repeat-associated protein
MGLAPYLMHKTRLSKRTQSRRCTRARKSSLRSYEFDAANRLADVTTGSGIDAPTTRYVHNALGQRLFKTEPLYAPVSTGNNPTDPGVIQVLVNFFASLWGGSAATAAPSTSEKLGYQYYYDEDGNLLYELGAGGANSTGNAHYIYLPTPSGPMPIAAVINAKQYAVHTDHLNTPRRLTQSDKRIAWQWAFSAFGDEQPTTGKNRYVDPVTTPNAGSTTIADVTFNLRYPGQYFDKESGLSYNYFRSYDSRTGRYTQADPIDLEGGWNWFGYVDGNPLMFTDPEGLQAEHTTNQRPSNLPKHQEGEARRGRDAGGEKGDQRRRPPSTKPPGHKGPWPIIPRIPGFIPLVCPLCEVLEPQPLPGPMPC